MHTLLTEEYRCNQESYEEVQRECSADWVFLYHQRCCEVCIRSNRFDFKASYSKSYERGWWRIVKLWKKRKGKGS